ncbi:3-isopropylmalate dehydratase large subunit [Agrobacterium vitis]|uniref:3-isopropylmalate dehydratase n=1 Tax=Agrobacterium vitis TaxID=373 RepID=A0A6L6VI40_AGRVI|nr:3-isopropylmalate dehydratase large subunit [Agrobacterium vitis]MUZ75266.1 3-isopropylmalate dehydratase large subunit [Agrobacterium vitis]
MTSPRSYFEKAWSDHVITSIDGETDLVYIDRLFLHELTGASTLRQLEAARRLPRRTNLVFTTIDHVIDTQEGRTKNQSPARTGSRLIEETRAAAERYGFHLFDVGDSRQGIVHVISAELGIALPGLTVVCGDSHTCTVGGIGALGWGIGSTESEQVLTAQSLAVRRPKSMRVTVSGSVGNGIAPKDVVLSLIRKIGVNGGIGSAVEFSGKAIQEMEVDGRLTLCNMTSEFGAKYGFVPPDDKTIHFLAGREFSPKERAWDQAVDHWRSLASDEDAAFELEVCLDCSDLEPQVSWGITPQHVVSIGERIPDPRSFDDMDVRAEATRAVDYMGLSPGTAIEGLDIQAAYIGACTNARLSDLRDAARILTGRRVAESVVAICVPGSMKTKADAEAEGLDIIFKAAGFEWHDAGCGLCGHMGNDRLQGKRVISTTNRNFVGRQGLGTRTHLASPATVAASAVVGSIADVRKLPAGGLTP